MRAVKPVTEAEYCITEFVLQVGSIVTSYGYIDVAVCWSNVQLEYT